MVAYWEEQSKREKVRGEENLKIQLDGKRNNEYNTLKLLVGTTLKEVVKEKVVHGRLES